MRRVRLYSQTMVLALLCVVAALCFVTTLSTTSLADTLPTKPSAGASPIAALRFLPDGCKVTVSQKIVTYSMGTSFYVEETDRSAGIHVMNIGYGEYPYEGDVVSFSGVMSTLGLERQIVVDGEISISASTTLPEPLGMKTYAVVGGSLNSFTSGIPNVLALNTEALRIRVWGKVTSDTFSDNEGNWCFYLDDGGGIADGSVIEGTSTPTQGIRIYSSAFPTYGEYKAVDGVAVVRLWDPTPDNTTNNDAVPIRAVRTVDANSVFTPSISSSTQTRGSVSGTVRLVGATSTSNVKVYCGRSSVIVTGVGDSAQSFTLDGIPSAGTLITATAPGYLSQSQAVYPDNTGITLELQPAESALDVFADKKSIRACGSETTVVSAVFRDAEGKGLAPRQVRIWTDRGVFNETGTKEITGYTDASGYLQATLRPGSDAIGPAILRAETYPDKQYHSQSQVTFAGPSVSATASSLFIDAGTTSTITGNVTDQDAAVSGATLIFTTDAGGFDEASGASQYTTTTNSAGQSTATLRLPSPGCATVMVRYRSTCGNESAASVVVARKGSSVWQPNTVTNSSPLIDRLVQTAPSGERQVAVVTTDKKLVVWNADGTKAWEAMVASDSNTPSCADLDADTSDGLEIVVPFQDIQKICAFNGTNGNVLAGWPATTNYTFQNVAAALADVNLDGELEVVSGDASCFVFAWNSTGDWNGIGSYLWRNLTGSTSTAIYNCSVAIGDIDNNGMPDAFVGSDDVMELYAFPGDAWGNHVSPSLYTNSWPRVVDSGVRSSPATGDIDGDGKCDMAVGGNMRKLFVYTSSDDTLHDFDFGSPINTSPALADLDGDGRLDIVFGSNNGKLYATDYLGNALPGWENGLQLSPTAESIKSSPVIADVNADGKPEVIVGCSNGLVYAIYSNARNHFNPDGTATGPVLWARCAIKDGDATVDILSAPTVDDLDGDGNVDVVVGSTSGVFRYEFSSTLTRDAAHMPWPTFHHDNARTGFAGTLPSPEHASIVGRVTFAGQPVAGAKVFITYGDETSVPVPGSTTGEMRGFVLSVGNNPANTGNAGGYSINQLEAGQQYKLKVHYDGHQDVWTGPFTANAGVNRFDLVVGGSQ